MPHLSPEKLDSLFTHVRERYPKLAVLAIQWIHLTNGRYEIAKNLETVSGFSVFLTILARSFWSFLKGFLFGLKVLWMRFVSRKVFNHLKGMPFDALARTWAFPKSSLQKGEDFYFGDLAFRLNTRKVHLLTLCGNAKENYWRSFLDFNSSDVFPYQLSEFCLINLPQIFYLCLHQCGCAFFIFWKALKQKDDLLRRLLFFVSKESLRHQTLRNALFYFIGKKAVSLWKPKFFISLYEGHAWEKCLWMGIKKADPSCKIVAYQHTVIFERTLSLRKPSLNGVLSLKPDIVLCTGQRTFEIMRESHEKSGAHLIPFGSFRFNSATELKEPSPPKKTVLVLPEGLLGESCILFNVAMKLSAQFSEYQFIFRTHPVLPLSAVIPHLEADPSTFKNIIISKEKNIEKDFERSSILLYRGSSSVLYGILSGLKPFYFRRGDEELNDPLFELRVFREYVSSVNDLSEKIQSYAKEDPRQVLKAWEEAVGYIQNYTASVKEESMENLLESVAS